MSGAGKERTARLLRDMEKFVPRTYSDVLGYATVGYGHLITEGDTHLVGKTLTLEQGEALLAKDIAEHEASGLKNLKVKITENQRSALVSLAFNAGPGASRKIVKLLNEGKTQEAADKFLEYNKGTDKATKKKVVVEGLTKRREFERKLFLTRDDEAFDENIDGRPSRNDVISTQRGLGIPSVFAGSPDAIPGQNLQILAALKDLNYRISGTDPRMEDFLNRLREEGRGAA